MAVATSNGGENKLCRWSAKTYFTADAADTKFDLQVIFNVFYLNFVLACNNFSKKLLNLKQV